MKTTKKTSKAIEKLRELLLAKSQILIVLQDNPDPDAIAAAIAFRAVVHKISNINCSIAHGGTVGRAENRALVKYLQLNLRDIKSINIDKFDLVVMLDTQPGTGNNSLPEGRLPDIVIDHHPVKSSSKSVPLCDIRPKYGATATILCEYLCELAIVPETPIATALLYAIRSDTQDLGRDSTKADINAFEWLYPLANKRMLSQIQRGRVERAYYSMLAVALSSARVFGPCIISNLSTIENPDMIAEVADLMLRDDETSWSICFGFCQDKTLISVRTSQSEFTARELIRKIVSRKGTGGGHDSSAGGQIPLQKRTKKEKDQIEKLIRKRILAALKVSDTTGVKLVKNKLIS